ncbi:MAG TPA: hypothetical protein PK819_01155, partial [Thermomicrobiales bacterium]|nr:hypothetical protein [Thermomicrobiales bacterium]
DCWVRTVDKRGEWHRSFVPSLSGEQRLVTHVLEILGSMPAGEEERTAVLLDIPRSENRRVQQWRKQMRDHNALAGRSSFGKVKSQEDTATGGEIIQLADMLAGAVNHQLQGDNATLGMLSGRIQLV